MNNLKTFVFLFLYFPFLLIAQTERPDVVWYLPDSIGLDFRNDTVKVIKSDFYGKELCAQFFYKNKMTWMNGEILKIGSSTMGWLPTMPYFLSYGSSTQPCFFVKDEKNDSCVYMYTIGPIAFSLIQLKINVINEQIITYKEFFMDWLQQSSVFEKNIGVRHTNGRDWWIIYPVLDNLWNVCLFENNNLQHHYYSEVGIKNGVKLNLITGQAKASRDGTQIAFAQDTGALYLADFSRLSGELNYRKHWVFPGYFQYGLYGVEFSENGNNLFYSGHVQNINSDALGVINLSDYSKRTLVDTIQLRGIRQMMLGPDNKIYFRQSYNTCSVIENPDAPLDSIQVSSHKYKLRDNNIYNIGVFGLPYFPNYYLGPDMRVGFEVEGKGCVGSELSFTDTSRGHFWREWDFGDGSAAQKYHVTQHANLIPSRIDTHKVVTHTYTQPGTYTITLKIINDSTQYGYLDTLMTKTISISPEGSCTQSQIWTAGNVLHYDMPQAKNLQLVLYNAIGQEVWEDTLPNSKGNFALPEHLPAAVYLIRVFHSNGEETIKWRKL